MSPALTMERVYDELRRQVIRGERLPGSRLDPARLAPELHASATPVRDALHRLVGERFVQSWPQEGFHVPIISEPGLRDLYGWRLEILLVILRKPMLARQTVDISGVAAAGDWDGLAEAAKLFRSIGEAAANFEHRHALANADDRLGVARVSEAQLFNDAETEARTLASLWRSNNLAALRSSLNAYHRRRIRAVPEIAALIRYRVEPPAE